MEIIFKSPRETERLLNDALIENHSETLSALLSAVCETIFTKGFLSKASFISSLSALEIQLDLFHSTLAEVKFNGHFTEKEEKVIQAAFEGLYSDDDIEGAFYKHGGYEGIIALILFFRKSGKIQKQWSAIAKGFRGWLVKQVAKMLSRETVEWIYQYISTKSMIYSQYALQYLGKHAGRKLQQQQQQQDIRQVVSTQDHRNFGSRIIAANTSSPQYGQPSNVSSDQNGASMLSTPVFDISSPSKDRPSITQQQDSQRSQHILPRSNITSFSDNNTPSSFPLAHLEDVTAYQNKFLAHVLVPPITSLDQTNFLALLYSLGGSQIRRDVLFRGLLLQKRWDTCGTVQEVTLQDAGINEHFARLFSSQTKLEQNIESCIQLGFIVKSVLTDGSPVYSISDPLQHQIPRPYKCEEMHLLGLMFTTYIFPRDQALEPFFQDLGKHLLPYLEHTWQYIQGEPHPTLPDHVRNSLVEASLATRTLVGASRAENMISLLAKVQDPKLPNHLRMAIAIWKSVSLRSKGSHDQSDILIQNTLESIVLDPADIRSHCSYGRLLLSRTENSILREQFDKAKSYLASWEVRNIPPSGLELQVVRLKNTVLGRVSRYEGRFSHACHCLKECLKTIPGDASRYHVMHHLADVYCELGISGKVEELVLDDIKQLRARGKQWSISYRRLVLSLVEAYIVQGMLDAAKILLRELLDIYDGISDHNISDQLGHVRSVTSLARISWHEARWLEACQSLERALVLTKKYKTFSRGSFYLGVIYLFLSIVNFEHHKYQESRSNLASADDILRKQAPRHFIPGMGTYFLEYLKNVRSLQWPSAD